MSNKNQEKISQKTLDALAKELLQKGMKRENQEEFIFMLKELMEEEKKLEKQLIEEKLKKITPEEIDKISKAENPEVFFLTLLKDLDSAKLEKITKSIKDAANHKAAVETLKELEKVKEEANKEFGNILKDFHEKDKKTKDKPIFSPDIDKKLIQDAYNKSADKTQGELYRYQEITAAIADFVNDIQREEDGPDRNTKEVQEAIDNFRQKIEENDLKGKGRQMIDKTLNAFEGSLNKANKIADFTIDRANELKELSYKSKDLLTREFDGRIEYLLRTIVDFFLNIIFSKKQTLELYEPLNRSMKEFVKFLRESNLPDDTAQIKDKARQVIRQLKELEFYIGINKGAFFEVSKYELEKSLSILKKTEKFFTGILENSNPRKELAGKQGLGHLIDAALEISSIKAVKEMNISPFQVTSKIAYSLIENESRMDEKSEKELRKIIFGSENKEEIKEKLAKAKTKYIQDKKADILELFEIADKLYLTDYNPPSGFSKEGEKTFFKEEIERLLSSSDFSILSDQQKDYIRSISYKNKSKEVDDETLKSDKRAKIEGFRIKKLATKYKKGRYSDVRDEKIGNIEELEGKLLNFISETTENLKLKLEALPKNPEDPEKGVYVDNYKKFLTDSKELEKARNILQEMKKEKEKIEKEFKDNMAKIEEEEAQNKETEKEQIEQFMKEVDFKKGDFKDLLKRAEKKAEYEEKFSNVTNAVQKEYFDKIKKEKQATQSSLYNDKKFKEISNSEKERLRNEFSLKDSDTDSIDRKKPYEEKKETIKKSEQQHQNI